MSLFIGIDSGTQSVKAVVLDFEGGQVVAEGRAPHRLIPDLPAGHMEQHPQEWVAAMEEAMQQALGSVDRTRVRGIGVSGQQHGFVPLDAKGQVIRPAKLWCDTSTAPECALITRKLGGPAAAIRATGNLILPGYTAPKILWLKRHEPASYRRLRQVLLPHDYLNFHLTGRYFMEHGDASGMALMDVRRRIWSQPAIKAIDANLAEWLPALSDSSASAGTLRPELARKLGLPADVAVSAGGGDNMMGAIGTGNVRPGVVTASFGTSGTIYAHASKPVVDPRGEIAAFCSSTGGWLPLLCTMNVTSVTETVGSIFGFDHERFDAAVASVPAGADGLQLLPYLAGERTPSLPGASGVAFGLNQRNFTPAHFARAAMEGTTLGMNYGLRRLAALGIRPKEIRVTGGGARSGVWRQLMADIFGVPVVGMKVDEGAALGGALQAAWCVARMSDRKAKLTDFTDPIVALDENRRALPNAKAAAGFRKSQERHDRLGAALRPLFAP